MTNRIIAEFDLGSVESIVEFNVDTEGDDLFFRLNTSIDYFLGGDDWNLNAKKILLQYNDYRRYLIENNRDGSKLRIKVIIEEQVSDENDS